MSSALLTTTREALPQALAKLDPRHVVRTPVIFVVWVGSVLTTVLSVLHPSTFSVLVTVWLWLTIVFANLAEAIKKVGTPDLVMFGMASTDGGMSVVPAMVAERLGLPQVTLASEITVDGSTVTIRRDSDAATQQVQASLPAVVSVTDQTGNEPRYPSFKGIMAAKKKPVQTWSLADLGIDADKAGLGAAGSRVEDATPRPPREQGTIVKDEGDGGTKLAEFLQSKKFI